MSDKLARIGTKSLDAELAERNVDTATVADIIANAIHSDDSVMQFKGLAELRAWRREMREDMKALAELQALSAETQDKKVAENVQSRLKELKPEQLLELKARYLDE